MTKEDALSFGVGALKFSLLPIGLIFLISPFLTFAILITLGYGFLVSSAWSVVALATITVVGVVVGATFN